MLKKYYYCEYQKELFYEVLRNEYHFIAFCYGVYTVFKKEDNSCGFSEYLKRKSKHYTSNWHFVNITHNLLKKNLEDKTISRREIRKLGYSGCQSLPRCSKKALLIQNCLIKMIISDNDFISDFVEAINNKWKNVNDIQTINEDVLFGMIVGFQANVLMRTKDSRELYNNMKQLFDYSIVGKGK